jgi:hypothetical protein
VVDDGNSHDDTEDDQTGYGKPPKQSRFKKGQSGNPAGRPKGSLSFKTLLMAALSEKITVKENGNSKRISKREAAAKQVANKAAMGDLRTLKFAAELLDRLEAREDEAISARARETSRERLARKLDAMSERVHARLKLLAEGK